jgi:hypothetical protein
LKRGIGLVSARLSVSHLSADNGLAHHPTEP